MRAIITGATGFIGKALTNHLLQSGYEVIALSRSQEKAQAILGDKVRCVEWDGTTSSGWAKFAEGADAIVNLAGANLSAKYWTPSYKKEIWDSRVNAGRAIVQAVMRTRDKPKQLIQASAVGYYGSRGDAVLDESSAKGEGFLSDLVKVWEESTEAVETYGVRRISIRSGVILGEGAVLLSRLRLPFKLYGGGYPGSGKQWLSWIHLQDEVQIIEFLMKQSAIQGAVNLTSPEPVTMKEFTQVFGKILNRPAWLRIPALALKAAFGEMAKEMFLAGQKVFPRRLLEAGYQFKYPTLEAALAECLKEGNK